MGETFVDRAGAEIISNVSLPPGHATFLDLRTGDVFRDDRLRRVQFRAGLEYPPVPVSPGPCANVVATLEIFDNGTGRTTVMYHPPDGVDPPDDTLQR